MTTIVLRDGVLAGDRACNYNGTRVGHRDKLRRIEGGRVAMTGYLPACLAIVEWIEGGEVGSPPKIEGAEVGSVIWVPDEGLPTLIELGQQSPLPDAPYHAWGVGRDLALGAMWKGASAEEAVRCAIELDLHTDGGPTVLGPKESA